MCSHLQSINKVCFNHSPEDTKKKGVQWLGQSIKMKAWCKMIWERYLWLGYVDSVVLYFVVFVVVFVCLLFKFNLLFFTFS